MIFDICLYKFCSGELSQYPTLEYAKEVISESQKLTFSLHGKRQFSLIKRGNAGKVLLYSIYNYVYNDQNDSLGICFVFYDEYPHNIDYMFKLCGTIIAEIIAEGKAFHFDSNGNIVSDKKDLGVHYSTLSKHKEKIKHALQNLKSNIRTIPQNVYNSYEDQHVICQLSDKSWTLDEMFKTNNIVVFTEEIEDENINSMRSFIKKSNETIEQQQKKIEELEAELKRQEQTRNNTLTSVLAALQFAPSKQSGISKTRNSLLRLSKGEKKQTIANPPQKPEVKKDESLDTIVWIVFVIVAAIILLNMIAPWFIPTVWPKLAVVFTGFGTYFVFKALDDDSNKKIYEILGWSGTVAILLSTILTIYGICGGFSPDTGDNTRVIQSIPKEEVVSIDERGNRLPLKSNPTVYIPENFVSISSGSCVFYIDKFEVTQKDYVTFMYNNPSVYQGDNLPVHGLSIRDAILYCNKRSEAEGYDGFYEINKNAVTIKEDGNGYRLPTEEEWMLAAKKSKPDNSIKYHFPNHKVGVKVNGKLEPHIVGEKKSEGQLLYDIYGNVCELCVRSNGEIWGKGGSYQNMLKSENNENAGFRAADNISSTKKLKKIFGLRLVLIPKK